MRSPLATMSTCLACLAWWAPAVEAEVKLALEGGVRERICWLTVEDVKGSYTSPYIQSARELRPRVWLIHLGVNDERGKVPALQFARNMEAIVDHP